MNKLLKFSRCILLFTVLLVLANCKLGGATPGVPIGPIAPVTADFSFSITNNSSDKIIAYRVDGIGGDAVNIGASQTSAVLGPFTAYADGAGEYYIEVYVRTESNPFADVLIWSFYSSTPPPSFIALDYN